MLKATILSTTSHGPPHAQACVRSKTQCEGHFKLPRYLSGTTWLGKQEAAAQYIRTHADDEAKWAELADAMWYDWGYEVDPSDLPEHVQQWADADAIKKRGIYAPCLCYA